VQGVQVEGLEKEQYENFLAASGDTYGYQRHEGRKKATLNL
jgi:hypothetical protein